MGRRKSSNKNRSVKPSDSSKAGTGSPPLSPPLHQEDAALWAQVTKSLTPLKNDHDRLHFGPLLDEKPDMSGAWPAPENARVKTPPPIAGSSLSQSQAANGKPASPVPVNPQLSGFSRREMRQIDRGHQPIEARLDLHGMVQTAAHVALRGFLVQSQAHDLRHVLVITGKGRTNPRDDFMYGGPESGVLRRVVPLWLGEPDLRAIVAGFSEAPRRHGGSGALYIRLRRKR